MRLIDGDRLKKTIKSLACESNNLKEKSIVEQTLHEIFPQIIDDEPNIEAEPIKHGKWIIIDTKYAENGELCPCQWVCSNCGYDTYTIIDYSYCPQCGAKMLFPKDYL